MLGVPSIEAAPIIWSSTKFTTHGTSSGQLDTGVIKKTGTRILAENSGGTALTFDGINFTAGTISFGSAYNGFFDSSSPLAATGTYGGNASGVTVPLSGLTSGTAGIAAQHVIHITQQGAISGVLTRSLSICRLVFTSRSRSSMSQRPA